MWRGNALHDRNEALCMQKLWSVGNAARAHGAERETKAKHGNTGRRTAEPKERIPKMVAQQEEVTAARSFLSGKIANSIKGQFC